MFDITGVTSQLGEHHYIVEVEKSTNARGDATLVKTHYPIFGIVQIMDGSESEVAEGLLEAGDIIAFYDDRQSNLSKLVVGNFISYKSKQYLIKNVIPNPGHIEVHAKKV